MPITFRVVIESALDSRLVRQPRSPKGSICGIKMPLLVGNLPRKRLLVLCLKDGIDPQWGLCFRITYTQSPLFIKIICSYVRLLGVFICKLVHTCTFRVDTLKNFPYANWHESNQDILFSFQK